MISQIPAPIHICPQYPILCSSTHPIARWYVGSGHAAPPISHSIIPSPVHWSLLAQVIGASYQQFVSSIHFSPGSLSFPRYVRSLIPTVPWQILGSYSTQTHIVCYQPCGSKIAHWPNTVHFSSTQFRWHQKWTQSHVGPETSPFITNGLVADKMYHPKKGCFQLQLVSM